MNIKELGRRVKSKYPGKYDDMTDEEVGRRVRAKYPQYDYVTDITKTEYRSTQVEDLFKYYSPEKGIFSTWIAKRKIERSTDLLKLLSEQQVLLIEMGARIEKDILEGKQNEVAYRTFVARHAAELVEIRLKSELTEQAASQGYTLENLQTKKLASDLTTLKVREARQLSKIKIGEQQALKKIDLEARWTEYLQDQRDVTLAQMEDYQIVDEVTERLFKAYELRKQIELSDDLAKEDKLRLLTKNIAAAERFLDERQTRHLQATDAENAQRTLPAYEPSGDDDQEDEAAPEPVPPKRGRGRPKGSLNKRGRES